MLSSLAVRRLMKKDSTKHTVLSKLYFNPHRRLSGDNVHNHSC